MQLSVVIRRMPYVLDPRPWTCAHGDEQDGFKKKTSSTGAFYP